MHDVHCLQVYYVIAQNADAYVDMQKLSAIAAGQLFSSEYIMVTKLHNVCILSCMCCVLQSKQQLADHSAEAKQKQMELEMQVAGLRQSAKDLEVGCVFFMWLTSTLAPKRDGHRFLVHIHTVQASNQAASSELVMVAKEQDTHHG